MKEYLITALYLQEGVSTIVFLTDDAEEAVSDAIKCFKTMNLKYDRINIHIRKLKL